MTHHSQAMMAAAAAGSAAGAAARARAAAAGAGFHRVGDAALHHVRHDPHASVKSEHRRELRWAPMFSACSLVAVSELQSQDTY